MRIATGVKNLRKDAKSRGQENNWQVYLDGEFRKFFPDTLDNLRCFYADCTLIGIQGNVVSFRTGK